MVSALAKASAWPPWSSWMARVLDPAKLKVTRLPGFAVWNAMPISLKDSVSDAAAKTRISLVGWAPLAAAAAVFLRGRSGLACSFDGQRRPGPAPFRPTA